MINFYSLQALSIHSHKYPAFSFLPPLPLQPLELLMEAFIRFLLLLLLAFRQLLAFIKPSSQLPLTYFMVAKYRHIELVLNFSRPNISLHLLFCLFSVHDCRSKYPSFCSSLLAFHIILIYFY